MLSYLKWENLLASCYAIAYANAATAYAKKNKIIPIFKAHSIQGFKQLDYQDFCEIATLIGEGKHLSPIGIAKIQLIKDRMNTKRK